jgi:enhancing lycopene biosynthesis protein 2
MAQARVGVILCGCGVQDGSEIHEAVCTLLELARNGAEAVCVAPDLPQAGVVDHRKGEAAPEKRNMMTEAARIARGKVRDIREIKASALDAVVLPGGYGAAKNLCDFATAGADCTVNPEVERLLLEMHAAGKPIGAICIAPVIVARVFGKKGIPVQLTIGTDPGTASKIRQMGATHVDRPVREICVDTANRIVSTPAYMSAERIDEAADGIALLIKEVLKLVR